LPGGAFYGAVVLLEGHGVAVIDCAAVDKAWLAGPIVRAGYPRTGGRGGLRSRSR
jgi:hypothetical protein